MSDEINPIEENTTAQQIPVAPKPVISQPQVAEAPAAPVAEEPKPAVAPAKPAMSLELPKAKIATTRPVATKTIKTVEVKKEEKPSIVSVAIDFVAAAVAVAFAVMIILDI